MNKLLRTHPGESFAMNDQEGSNPVDPRPKRLANQFRIEFAETTDRHAVIDTAPQKIERLHAWGVRICVLLLVESFGNRHHERRPVMMGIFKAELDVGNQAPLEALDRIAGQLLNAHQHLPEAGKSLLANLFEQFRFILEIQVDGRRGIFDFVGDAAHGDVFIALFDEEFAGRVEDLLAQELFLPRLAFFNAQRNSLTPLSIFTSSYPVKPFFPFSSLETSGVRRSLASRNARPARWRP